MKIKQQRRQTLTYREMRESMWDVTSIPCRLIYDKV